MEAAKGCKKDIEIPINANCDRCKGSGSEPGSKIVTCSTCNGTGQVFNLIINDVKCYTYAYKFYCCN